LRLSLRDRDGREVDHATATDPGDAVHEAAMLLVRRSGLYVGDMLSIDEDHRALAPGTPMAVTAAGLQALAGRLEQRAGVIAMTQPLSAEDLRLAARLCRHALRVGWIGGSVAIVT
jgi:hypothetical protein